MIEAVATPNVFEISEIPYVTADEAYSLLTTELERFLTVVENISPDDWGKPTACSEWNVRQILAHQAGGFAGGARIKELLHQLSSRPKPGQLPEDAINIIQQRDRAAKTPAELIAEVRKMGPVAVKNWAYGFQLLKLISIPHAVAGKLPLRHLMWVTHSRDTWMHRLDICRATGQAFEQTAGHDGRIAALVMRDVAQALSRLSGCPTLNFDLTGIAGGNWKIGKGDPAAIIRMDVLEFNIFASGRYTYQQARPLAAISGDVHSAETVLKKILIVY